MATGCPIKTILQDAEFQEIKNNKKILNLDREAA